MNVVGVNKCEDHGVVKILVPCAGAENTLADDSEFWSSSGSAFHDESESLTYRLKYPVCILHTVQLAVYRALFQFG